MHKYQKQVYQQTEQCGVYKTQAFHKICFTLLELFIPGDRVASSTMLKRWERPQSVSYPKVWSRFRGRINEDGTYNEYTIQDVTEDMYEDIVQHMLRYFLPRETLTVALGETDELSKRELAQNWNECLHQKVSLVALVNDKTTAAGKPRIAGCNVLYVCSKDETKSKFSGKAVRKIMHALDDVVSASNVFERHGITEYLSAFGIAVDPSYSGEGIGYQLLKAREPLCREVGLKLTGTVFTGDVSQHLARKAGFALVTQFEYDKYKINNEFVFKGATSKYFSFMEKVIP